MQPLSELHLAARRYAEAGIPIFPVEVGGKKPVTANGFYDATTDLQKIDDWWLTHEYNIGFSPGTCGLSVIDFDPGALLSIKDFPRSYTVKTPRGFHLYLEGALPSTASKLAEHVDTRSIGGYVLVPPSCVAGNLYTLIDNTDYAPLPNWVSESLNKPQQKLTASVNELDLEINIQRVKDLLTKYVDNGNVAIEGQGGDDLTYRMCCEILDLGVSPDTCFNLLSNIWNPACHPPWTDEELANKVQNAEAFRQNEIGAHAIEPPQKVFGAIVAALYPVKRSRFYFKDEEEQENEADPRWIIKDLISERSTCLLYGPTQSYKSFLALEMALSVAMGIDTFGSPTISGPVFYAALEGRAHLKKARRAWKVAKGIREKIDTFYIGLAPMVGLPGECEEFVDQISKRTAGAKPKIIIIDTLGKSMAGLNENDAKDAGHFIQYCDHLVESFGCSVIAIHHTGKDQARGARGSSAFHAGFDTVIEVNASRLAKAVSVSVKKHKDAEEREIPWTFEGRLVGPSLAFFPTTPKEHHALTNEESQYSPRKIGAALQNLGAYGIEHAVTTAVLSSTVTPRVEAQSEEDFQLAVSRTARMLHKAGKGFLEAYTIKTGKQLVWCLPAPVKD